MKASTLRSSALLSLLIFSTSALAEGAGVACFACMALSKEKCKTLLEVFDKVDHPRLTILWRTFGPPEKDRCASMFLRRYAGRPHTLVIHFANGAGLRNGRLAPYEFHHGETVETLNRKLHRKNAGTLRRIRREARRIVAWVTSRESPELEVELSTGLEDNFTNRAYRAIFRELKKNIPSNWGMFRNPVGETEGEKSFRGSDYIELHGVRPHFNRDTRERGRCSYNNDGIDVDLGSGRPIEPYVSLPEMCSFLRRARGNNCRSTVWWSAIQGLESGSGFSQPRRRNFRVYSSDINAVKQLIENCK